MNNELSCQELVELVTEYLEGALSENDKQRFEDHVSVCHDCHSYFDQMRHTIRLIGRLSETTINPTAKDELLTLFRDWKKELPPTDE